MQTDQDIPSVGQSGPLGFCLIDDFLSKLPHIHLYTVGMCIIFWYFFHFTVSFEVYLFPKAKTKKIKTAITYERRPQYRNLSQDVENAKLANLDFVLSPHCNWCHIKDLSNVLVIMELQKRVLLFCLVTASHWLCQIMSQTSGSLWEIKSDAKKMLLIGTCEFFMGSRIHTNEFGGVSIKCC